MSHHHTSPRLQTFDRVPFSWENSPGISKVTPPTSADKNVPTKPTKLALPPCPSDVSPNNFTVGGRGRRRSIHFPLPTCPLLQPVGSVGKDPFLAAYMEINNEGKDARRRTSSSSGWGGIGNKMSLSSCKQGPEGVREDGMVRVRVRVRVSSQLMSGGANSNNNNSNSNDKERLVVGERRKQSQSKGGGRVKGHYQRHNVRSSLVVM